MAKRNNVKLKKLYGNEQKLVLDLIHSDEELVETFSGSRNTVKRMANSGYTALIKQGNTDVGFIMLVWNGRSEKFEIDMGILSQYRGKGYGTQALALLKEIILNNPDKLDVEIQAKQVNEAAIRSIQKNGFVLYREDSECFYFKLPDGGKRQGR